MSKQVDKFSSVIVVSLGAFGGILFGLVTQAIIAARFGAGRELDAYFLALVIPNTLVTIMVGTLNLIFLPMFIEFKESHGEGAAWQVASQITAMTTLILLALCALVFVFAADIVRILASEFSPGTQQLASEILQISTPIILLSGFNAIILSLLHIYGRFGHAVIATLVANAIYTVALFPLTATGNVLGLAVAVVLQYGAIFLVQLIAIWDLRRHWRRPRIDFANRDLQRLLRNWAVLMSSSIFRRFNPVVERYFAAQTGPGGISYLSLGTSIIRPINNFFLNSVATVLFPSMATDFATDRRDAVKQSMNLAMRLNGFLVIPIIVGLVVLRTPIVEVLLQRGKFDASDTVAVANVLAIYSGILFAAMVSVVTSKALYALQAVRFLALLSIYNVLSLFILNITLMPRYGYLGIALATTISLNMSWPVQLMFLHRRIGSLGLRRVGVSYAKFAILSVVMGVAVTFGHQLLVEIIDMRLAIIPLFIAIALGGLVYVCGAWLIRLDEMQIVTRNTQRLIKRFT